MIFERAWTGLKRAIVKRLWRDHRGFLLDRKGFWNHTIQLDDRFLGLFVDVYSQRRAHLTLRDMYNIYKFVQQVGEVEGDIAEVGVYKGGTARIICEIEKNKRVHLFDTFEGMPPVNPSVDKLRAKTFSDTSLKEVMSYLGRFTNVRFYKGLFPESARDLCEPPVRFSFVHLDVDIYDSTLKALQFFYPRLSRGAMLLSHDYRFINCPGVKKAFDEFFEGKPEPVIELWDNHCLVVKQ